MDEVGEDVRLQKYMAECGVASRRKCEEIINAGRVMVNGILVVEQGIQVEPEVDTVAVDGQIISHCQQKLYLMLHKPKGVVTTVSDQFGRKNVLDLIQCSQRIFPVGRLDYDTEGLLLLTNDGEFAYQLTHPKCEIEKCYEAKVKGIPDEKDLKKLRTGIEIDGRLTAPAKAEWKNNKLYLTIHEGRNRQVRKMLDGVGHPVIELKRISLGKLQLGELPVGHWRNLTKEELILLENERNYKKIKDI